MKFPVNQARFVVHRLREAALYPQMVSSRKGRKIVVLQSGGREMSSLLRGYEIAKGLRVRGWSCIVIPKQLDLKQRERVLRRFKPDLALLLGSRDPRNSSKLLSGIPYLYDLDDADFLDPKLTEIMQADVQAAAGVVAGSRYVADWCRQYNPNTRIVWTGSRSMVENWTDHTRRSNVVTWAQSAPLRLPIEFDFVVSVMEELAQRRDGLTLRLYGGDGTGDGGRSERLRSCGISVEWMPFLKYSDFVASLDSAAVGFSPICVQSEFSRGKSFGKILAYLDARVPIVTSDGADHSAFFTKDTGVVSNDMRVWVDETEQLLDDPTRRNQMAKNAYEHYLRRLSLDVAVEKVQSFIVEIMEQRYKFSSDP